MRNRTRLTRYSPGSSARGRRGYILVATAFSLVFLLGVAGLSIDIGRMYVTKNEAQAYVDSASLAAVMKLDGTSAGIASARTAAGSDTGKWRFDTQPFDSVTVSFATSSTGTFTTTPPDPPTGYNYVKVVAVVSLPMYLIRPLSGPSATIAASAVAGGQAITTLPNGIFPFSPYTRIASPDDATDPYGYQVGSQYTLRWGAPGDRTDCGTDATRPNLANNGSVRGYCCVSESAADLRRAIVSGDTDTVTIGQDIPMDNGAKNTEMSAIGDRVTLDTDTTSSTYSAYRAAGRGNGTRVVVVAVNGGAPHYTAIGFAAFFLLTSDYYSGLNGNDSACAEYIGAWHEGQIFPPTGGSGGYHYRLVK